MNIIANPLRRHALRATLVAAASLAGLSAAFAQPYPNRPIRFVVVAPAGGASDIVARVLAEGLTPLLGRSVVVENKPGALGAIGTQDMLSAPHDGYSFLIAPDSLATEVPYLVKAPFDPFKDIKPLVEITRTALVMVGNPKVPASNLKELVAWVKSQPGKVNYASYSTGTVSHILGLTLNKAAGLDMTHVGYKGAPPALQDVMGGHVPLMFDTPVSSIPMLKAGRIKAFAVSSAQRLAALPNVPTFAELGYPQMVSTHWIGLWSAPDVPAEARALVREAALQVLKQAKVAERFAELGVEVGQPTTPEQMALDLRKAHAEHGEHLKAIGFKPE